MILTKQSMMAAFNIRKQTGMEKRSKRHVALTSGGCDLTKSGRMKDREMQEMMTLGFLSPSSTEFLSCTQSSQLFPTAESVSFSWMVRGQPLNQAQTISSLPVVEGVTANA